MDVTDEEIERVDRNHIHRPLEEFAAVWRGAVAQMRADGWPPPDYFVIGVVRACRWLAGLNMVAPASARHPCMAFQERIVEETLHAAAHRNDAPGPGDDGPDRMDGVLVLLEWAWYRSEPSPLIEIQRRRVADNSR